MKRLDPVKLKRRGSFVRILIPLKVQTLRDLDRFHPQDDRALVIRRLLEIYCNSRKKLEDT